MKDLEHHSDSGIPKKGRVDIVRGFFGSCRHSSWGRWKETMSRSRKAQKVEGPGWRTIAARSILMDVNW